MVAHLYRCLGLGLGLLSTLSLASAEGAKHAPPVKQQLSFNQFYVAEPAQNNYHFSNLSYAIKQSHLRAKLSLPYVRLTNGDTGFANAVLSVNLTESFSVYDVDIAFKQRLPTASQDITFSVKDRGLFTSISRHIHGVYASAEVAYWWRKDKHYQGKWYQRQNSGQWALSVFYHANQGAGRTPGGQKKPLWLGLSVEQKESSLLGLERSV